MSEEARSVLPEFYRKILFDAIAPELAAIQHAVKDIEVKVGVAEGTYRTEAIRAASQVLISSFVNVPCAAFGWAEIPSGKDGFFTHTSSYAHPEFISQDMDFLLAGMMENLTRLLDTERYEIVETVQRNRAEKAKT